MSRLVNFDGYGINDAERDDEYGMPVLMVESTVSPEQVSGQFQISFGIAEKNGEDWFVVLAPDESILGGAPISESVIEFLEAMVDLGQYQVVVEFVESIAVDEDRKWFEMQWVDVESVVEGQEVYVEEASVEGTFQAQILSLLSNVQE